MSGKLSNIFAYIVIANVFLINGCYAEMDKNFINREKIVFYESFAGFNIPLKPIGEISKEEALSRNSYCIGYYNDKGNLYRFEKYLDGNLFFRHDYQYYDNGSIKESKTINAAGEVVTHIFDKSGKGKIKNN